MPDGILNLRPAAKDPRRTLTLRERSHVSQQHKFQQQFQQQFLKQ